MRRRLAYYAVAAGTAALALTGCAASSSVSGGSSSSTNVGSTSAGSSGAGIGLSSGTASVTQCSPAVLGTHTAGTLTVATDSPAYAPWFVDDKPSNGKGFESAVAFAVAKQLGYPASKVKWTVATFDSVIASTKKSYDFDIDQFSITAARAKVVDFSSGYYDVAQAVVTLKKSKYAKATTIAAFKGAKLAAQKGSTSLDAINDVIKPGRAAAEFPTNDLAVQALKNGQVDGLVVDLPTAFYVVSAQISNGTIVGQLAATGSPEQFGMVLAKNSPLTSCVSQAVDALRANGTLKALQDKWLASAGNAPELK